MLFLEVWRDDSTTFGECNQIREITRESEIGFNRRVIRSENDTRSIAARDESRSASDAKVRETWEFCCSPPDQVGSRNWRRSDKATRSIDHRSNPRTPSLPLHRISPPPKISVHFRQMTTPLVVEQPLEFSATYTTLPVDPTMTVKIPALGNGWNFFWRVNSQGSLETGVTGGIVQAHWKTIKFNVARANSGHMSFSQTVDVAALAGKQWSGQVSNIQSYRNAGQATTSRLEIAINPILGVVEKPAIIPRIGTGYTGQHSICHLLACALSVTARYSSSSIPQRRQIYFLPFRPRPLGKCRRTQQGFAVLPNSLSLWIRRELAVQEQG